MDRRLEVDGSRRDDGVSVVVAGSAFGPRRLAFVAHALRERGVRTADVADDVRVVAVLIRFA